jgi:hypothetical protein
MYKMELHEGESPEQRTENVEECVNEIQWVKNHQLQRHLDQSWTNTTTPSYNPTHNTKAITIYILKVAC